MFQKGFTGIFLILGVVVIIIAIISGAFLVNSFLSKTASVQQEKEVLAPNKTISIPTQSPVPTLIPKPEKVANNPSFCAKQTNIISPTSDSSSQSGINPQEAKMNEPLYPTEVIAELKGGKASVKWLGTGQGGSEYLVCRRTSDLSDWQLVGEVKVIGDNRGNYSFEDMSIKTNTSYIYGVRFVDIYENYSQITEEVLIIL